MGQHKCSLWLMVAVSFFLIYSSAIAEDEYTDRRSLKGLKGICVRVIISVNETEELKKRGLYEETIRTDAELKLRMAGVNVVSIDELNKILGRPLLVVSLAGVPVAARKDTGDKYMAFGLTITFFQDVLLSRNMEQHSSAATWSDFVIIKEPTKEKRNYVRGIIKDRIDKFVKAYLSVNPKLGE